MKQRFSPVVLAMAATAVAFIALPILAILVRAPWSDAWDIVAQKTTRDALLVSLQTSVIAACIASIIGIPLSWVLARSSGRGISVLRTISIVPIVLPPVVGGIALLAAFGRRGVVGQYLYDWWGVSLPFTRTAVVMAQVFVALPFFVLAVEAAFRQNDRHLEEAAETLGASPLRVFLTVALPLARPAIIAGFALSWARSLGEFGASITFAGSFPGKTQTLPMAVYELVSVDYQLSLVLSLLMVAISVAVLVGLRDRWMSGAER
jgi:molybdate transport system permease protein